MVTSPFLMHLAGNYCYRINAIAPRGDQQLTPPPTPRRNGILLSPQTTLALLHISHSLRLFDFGSSNDNDLRLNITDLLINHFHNIFWNATVL